MTRRANLLDPLEHRKCVADRKTQYWGDKPGEVPCCGRKADWNVQGKDFCTIHAKGVALFILSHEDTNP